MCVYRNVDMLREELHAQEQRATRAELALLTMSELQVNAAHGLNTSSPMSLLGPKEPH